MNENEGGSITREIPLREIDFKCKRKEEIRFYSLSSLAGRPGPGIETESRGSIRPTRCGCIEISDRFDG